MVIGERTKRARHYQGCTNSTGNSTGNNNVLKRNRALGFVFSIQSSVYGATAVAKVSLFSTWIRSTVSFYSM